MTTNNPGLRQRMQDIGQVRMGAPEYRRPTPDLAPMLRDTHDLLDQGHHTVTFTGGGGWVLRHPESCPHDEARACPVSRAAHKTLRSPEYLPGTYACHVQPGGWLRTTGGRR